jgi:putative heme iron utilization protein
VTRTLRELLEAERHGILATLSARRQGWPFASVAAYALPSAGEPVLLFSDLAEHTRNLRSDPRASLLVQDSAALDDPQAGSRVTLLGTVKPVPADDVPAARESYLTRHPMAGDNLAMADFRLYTLRVIEARFISGFGDMGWLTAERLQAALTTR